MGAEVLLMDEDTCATNFMMRDAPMMELVAKEPITPFSSVVKSLWDDHGISSILVIGGTASFFGVAHHVLVMEDYKCRDATERAKEIWSNSATPKIPNVSFASLLSTSDSTGQSSPSDLSAILAARYPNLARLEPTGKVKVPNHNSIVYGNEEIDVSALEQIISGKAQVNAIAAALQAMANLEQSISKGEMWTLLEALQHLEALLTEQRNDQGLDAWTPAGQFNGSMVRPRLIEIAGAVNRLRRQNLLSQKRTTNVSSKSAW